MRYVTLTLTVSLAAMAVAYNIYVWTEMFGDGPPFYGRTTNMDKWDDPRPWIIPMDIVAACAILLTLRRLRRPRDQRT